MSFVTTAPLRRSPAMGGGYPGEALALLPVGSKVEVDFYGSGTYFVPDYDGEVLVVRPAYGYVDARLIARA